jgi:hypothetical protein
MSFNFTTLVYKISERRSEYLDDLKPLHFIEITPILNTFAEEFDYILFKNFYASNISIVQFVNSKWKCILSDYKLMNDPDCDEDAERYFIINKKQLSEPFNKDSTVLRIYLNQDSNTIWKEFTIRNLKFVKEVINSTILENNTDTNNNDTNNELIKYYLTNSRYEINKLVILNDKEEMNQKYIEMNNMNVNELTFKILK